MDWWEYLHPDNPLSSRVVATLKYGFYLWLILLAGKIIHLAFQRWQMSRLQNVEPLRDELARRTRGRRADRAALVETWAVDGEAASRAEEVTRAKELFGDFCRGLGVPTWGVVADHVRSIFTAGWKSSHLEVDSLARHTSNRLFRFNGVLRSMLSLFIIAGLLGTLFGLAASLAQLSPLMSATAQEGQLNSVVGLGLRNLLKELKGAFAPSIWGVIYTIAGVLVFAFYSYFCRYVKDTLDGLTQNVWLADLYPSPLQQQVMSLVQTEELIQKNRESVEVVAEVARNIRPDMLRLQQRIGEANSTLESLTGTSTRISDFAERFREAVAGLEPFQEELRALYTQLQSESRLFHQTVRANAEQSADFQRQAGEMLARQGEKIEGLLRALNSYETAYIDARHDIDAKLLGVLDKAQKAYEQLGARNEEMDRAIRESLAAPLRQDLTQSLGEVRTTLETKLAAVVSRFGTFEAPLKDSAERIRIIADTIDRKAVELTGKLRQEYRAQGDANRQQLEALAALSQRLSEVLTQFVEAGRVQGNSTGALRDSNVSLGTRLDALSAKLDGLAPQGASDQGGDDFRRINQMANGYATAIIRELRALGSAIAAAGDGHNGAARRGSVPGEHEGARQRTQPEPTRRPEEGETFSPPQGRRDTANESRPDLIPHGLHVKGAAQPTGAHAAEGTRRDAHMQPDDATAAKDAGSEELGLVLEEPSLVLGDAAGEPGWQPAIVYTDTNVEVNDRRASRIRRWFGRVAGAVKAKFRKAA